MLKHTGCGFLANSYSELSFYLEMARQLNEPNINSHDNRAVRREFADKTVMMYETARIGDIDG